MKGINIFFLAAALVFLIGLIICMVYAGFTGGGAYSNILYSEVEPPYVPDILGSEEFPVVPHSRKTRKLSRSRKIRVPWKSSVVTDRIFKHP